MSAAEREFGQVVPVLLGALPLKEDMAEAGPVYRALCALTLSGEAGPVMPSLLPAFMQVCLISVPDKLDHKM